MPISGIIRSIPETAGDPGERRPTGRDQAVAPLTQETKRSTPSVKPPCHPPGVVVAEIHHTKYSFRAAALLSIEFNQVQCPHRPVGTQSIRLTCPRLDGSKVHNPLPHLHPSGHGATAKPTRSVIKNQRLCWTDCFHCHKFTATAEDLLIF